MLSNFQLFYQNDLFGLIPAAILRISIRLFWTDDLLFTVLHIFSVRNGHVCFVLLRLLGKLLIFLLTGGKLSEDLCLLRVWRLVLELISTLEMIGTGGYAR